MVSILTDGRLSVGRGVPPTGMTEAGATVKADTAGAAAEIAKF
ncbi:hypothetical protein [Microvirga aerilata]|jgi:hypothetical protein|nr:hypothetical protein [Microvirga aerilata]